MRLHNFKFLAFGILVLSLSITSNLFADAQTRKVRQSVKPLDLSRVPTTEELMAAGQLGGQLHPTYKIDDKTKEEKINLDFGKAIQEWNRHNYKEAVKMFRKYSKDYPDSPWKSEADLHVGCDATYHGRYSEAEALFTKIITENKNRAHEGANMLVNKARQRLGTLKILQSNFSEAINIFSELKKESTDWRHRTYASHWIQKISQYRSHELSILNCGVQTVAHILKKDGREAESRDVLDIKPSSLNGHSIKEIKALAEKYGYRVSGLKLSVSDLKSIPMPAITQISGKNEGDKGHYWVLEHLNNNELVLFDPQSGRRYTQSIEEFSKEWDGYALVFSNDKNLPGIRMQESEMEQIYGACCGAPRRETSLGNSGDVDGRGGDGNDNDSEGCGSAIWKVNMINMNMYVKDIPLWYYPQIGPSVRIQLSYNSQSAIAYNEPFGNKWQFNYGSYLIEDTGGQVTIFMPDGKRDVFAPDGSGGYIQSYKVYNNLVKIEDNHFELRFPDDMVYIYNIPPGTSSLQPFLVEIRNAYGQNLTFTYNASVQLTTIADATGKTTSLLYNSNGLVYQLNDPFGRSALFEYDADNNLTKITDMGGYWTGFSYDQDIYITSIEKQQGTWSFITEPADGIPANGDDYPPPGDDMWQNHRITVTNPLGWKEEYMYYAGCGYYTCSGVSWYVSPRDYITWQSRTINNYASNTPKILYHFTTVSQSGEISKITYPEGGYVEYAYNTNGDRTSVKDTWGNTTSYSYNTLGRITSITDPKGIVTSMTYAGNDYDLMELQNGLGKITLTYNSAHDITSIKDRLGNTTAFQYNSYGQLTQNTDALGVVTGFAYDSSNNLQQVSRGGNDLESFTYDNIGRINTHTDSSGLTLDYDYNNLDNVTKITYPDGKFMSYAYSGCCPRLIDSVTERSGNITRYTYDTMKHIIESVDPQGRTIKYEYDANGNMAKLIDSNSNVTMFDYDSDNRLVRKNYSDGKYETYSYHNTGLLKKKTNNRGIATNYSYDQNYNLLSVIYSDSTSGVTYAYDNYNRITQRQDGIGTFTYTYDLNSRLTSVEGPWANDTITFQYDKIGQLKVVTPQVGQAINYNYDPLGRLTTVQSGTSTFTYGYTGVTPLIQSLTRPNDSVTEYLYNDPLKRLTEITNKTSAQVIINKHVFAYNNLDLIDTETVTTGTALDSFTAGQKTYEYNKLNQLLSSTNPAESFTYDDDGNMTRGYTPEGYQFTATYDAENRLISIQYTDSSSVVRKTEYYYSGENLLAQVKKYDNSILVSDTKFVKSGFLPIQERDGSNSLTREYTWGLNMGGGIGGLLSLQQGEQNYFYLYDGKGNVSDLLDSSQNVVASYRYDVFGKPLKKTGTLDQPYRFSTKQYDEPTGIYNYGWRFYSPILGRWLTRDPLGEAGGINLYNFVGNNPVNVIDPWGLSGILTIYASGNGDGSSGSGGLSGHSWIAYTQDWGSTTTYGTWGNNPYGLGNGLHENLEQGRQGDASRSIYIDDNREATLYKIIDNYRKQGEDAWRYTSPCSSFTSDAWNRITGENLNPYGPYSNPSSLKNSIINANGGAPNYLILK